MSDINPYDLFKFIQKDVTEKQMFEATDSAYKDVDEGKLYKNLNNIDNPEEAIQSLKEKDKNPDCADNPAIKTDNAGVTEKPEITKIQKQMDKETPDVDKKSDFEASAGVAKTKEVKNKTVRVNTLQKEGKLPDNLNNVDNAEDYIQDLAEYDSNQHNGKIVADGISEESVARDLALKNNGVAVMNPDTKLWSVKTTAQENSSGSSGIVPASAARESVKECECGCDSAKDCTCSDKKEEVEESKVDEEKTTGDCAGQPEEASTAKAVHIQNASKARSNATDKQTADSQSTKVEDQVGQGVANAQKIVTQSAARTKATDKQTAKSATSDITKDQGPEGKSAAQSDVNKSAARKQATDGTAKPAPMVDGTKKVKEDVAEGVDVSVTTDDGDVHISSDGTSTTVTTSNNSAELPIDALGIAPEPNPMIGEPVSVEGPELDPMLDDELFLDDEEQPEFSDMETLEMAEKLLVAEHLEAMIDEKKMSAKQKKFVDDMKAKKFSKKNKKKVDDKKKEIK